MHCTPRGPRDGHRFSSGTGSGMTAGGLTIARGRDPSIIDPASGPLGSGLGGGAVRAGPGILPNVRITADKKLMGTFIGTPHPVMTEFVGHFGFDFVCIDAEHNAMHLETVQKMLQSLK